MKIINNLTIPLLITSLILLITSIVLKDSYIPSLFFLTGSLINYFTDKYIEFSHNDKTLEYIVQLKNIEHSYNLITSKLELFEDDLRKTKNTAELGAKMFVQNQRKPTL